MDTYLLPCKALIAWTPKCACTSLYLLVKSIHNIDCPRYDYKIYTLLNDSNIESYKNHKKIIVMRNPYHRIVSCFINKFLVHPISGILNNNKLESFAKDLLGNHANLTFNEFLHLLKTEHTKDTHWNLQHRYENITYDYIVHIENLEFELKTACRNVGIYIKQIPHENKTMTMTNTTYKDLSNIKNNILVQNHLNNISINNFLTPQNKEVIYKIYEKDFILGNYPK